MKIFRKILYILATFLTLCSILSIFHDAEIRHLKMLDFPRIQLFFVTFITLVLLAITVKRWRWYSSLLIAGLISGLLINGYFLINYTSLVPVEVPLAGELNSYDEKIGIFLTNVKMSNRKAEPLKDLIALKNPDLILAMEIDKWWNKELQGLKKEYPYSHHVINEVAYGMVLYSKLPIEDIEVHYLNNENVPSFESILVLPKGQKIKLYCVHPVPPVYFEKLPDNVGQKENALVQMGHKIKSRNLPVLVAGDLNDVVWSRIDKLTGTNNLLFDIRVGRGFYSSYNAENIFNRWPLDHVFVTNEFRLKKLELLPHIGSDHFPYYVELVL